MSSISHDIVDWKVTPDKTVNNVWYSSDESDLVIVFVHGILSNSRDCWMHTSRSKERSVYWPELIRRDDRFPKASLYLAGYCSDSSSGQFDLTDAASRIFSSLFVQSPERRAPVLSKKRIVFVCHSLGGIVVRHMLVRRREHFRDKKVGLALMGSPAFGSFYGSLLRPLARLIGNKHAIALASNNQMLREIQERFSEVLEDNLIPGLKGTAACEHHFFYNIPLLPAIVARSSASGHFGRATMIENTTHSSLVKPDNRSHPSHVFLLNFMGHIGVDGEMSGADSVRAGEVVSIKADKGNEIAVPVPFTERSGPVYTQPARSLRSLVGRDELRSQLKKELISTADRTVSLWGIPGSGKTALALDLAHDPDVINRFDGGILWADLGPTARPSEVLGFWGATLGISLGELSKLNCVEQKAAYIRSRIGSKKILIVLDDAWDEATVNALKVGGSSSSYLITTRTPDRAAGFSGDANFEIRSLDRAAAWELFQREATSGGAKASPVKFRERIEPILEGFGYLPLAVILLGRYLRPAFRSGDQPRVRIAISIVESELNCPSNSRDAKGVTSEIGRAIGLSAQALNAESKEALQALAVIPPKPNTFAQAAALAIAGVEPGALYELVDSGLVEAMGNGRYALHQAVAYYIRSLGPMAVAQQRMCNYYYRYAVATQNDLGALEGELRNILAAFRFSRYRFSNDIEIQFVDALDSMHNYFESRGLISQSEVFDYLRIAEEAARRIGDISRARRALLNLGRAQEKAGDYERAYHSLMQGLPRTNEEFDKLTPHLRYTLGVVEFNRANYTEASIHLAMAEKLTEKGPPVNARLMSRILQRQGEVTKAIGDLDGAQKLLERALGFALALQDTQTISEVLLPLACVELSRGMYAQSEMRVEQGLTVSRGLGLRESVCALLHVRAMLCRTQATPQGGNVAESLFQKAENDLTEALLLARAIRHLWYESAILCEQGEVAFQQSQYYKARKLFLCALQTAKSVRSPDREGFARFGLARALSSIGKQNISRLEADAACRVFERIGHCQNEHVKKWVGRSVDILRRGDPTDHPCDAAAN